MINQDTMYNVKNRSSSIVVYKIPETNLRREFAPGETKRLPFGELEKLTYQPGGRELIENFLQIIDEAVTSDLNVHREPEYDMSEEQVKDLILTGSYEAFLDALDFAPIGIIDLIKSMSVSLPVQDINKREALKNKLGFDVDRAIANDRASKEPDPVVDADGDKVIQKKAQPAAPAGRRTAPTYKVVSKEEKAAE